MPACLPQFAVPGSWDYTRCMTKTWLLGLLLLASALATPARAAGAVWLVDLEGAIGPATAQHLQSSLDRAEAAGVQLVILRLDTPGGLDTAMRDMIRRILAADVPVATWVGPSGARAASAGTYLLYASHIAAMAPGTNLGAATPVQIGGMPSMPGGKEEESSGGGAMERKVVNDAVAYLRGLAEMRGRNADWAELAVREGASLPASEALEKGVIDLMANNPRALLAQLQGREVTVGERQLTLDVEGAPLETRAMDWRSEFLAIITNPNVAYILLMVGIYGLILEFYNPGMGLPGITGAVCLLLALYAFQMLPVSYAGLGLLALGVALMVAEAFAPSFGVLGLGGIVAFVFGSVMLMDSELPGYRIAWPMILAVALFSAGLLVFALGMVLRARKAAVVSGVDHLLGQLTTVGRVDNGRSWVWLDGELWQARCERPLAQGDRVKVEAIDGLVAVVSPADKQGVN